MLQKDLNEIYGETIESGKRYANLGKGFKEIFGEGEIYYFSSPGRTEIIGNHTDHNHGKVLTASITMDTIGAARKNGTDIVRMVSAEYNQDISIDLTKLSSYPKCEGTLSLLAGIFEGAMKSDIKTGGFDLYVSTDVISAAGVSSSASFEMLIMTVVDHFFNEGKLTPVQYAKTGQYAENVFWKKASGLLDQMACAIGGTVTIDFYNPDAPVIEKVDFDYDSIGQNLIIVNTGKGHADLSEEYSSVPAEMKAAAKFFGKEVLAEVPEELFMEKLNEVRKAAGDRAVLRAIHFYQENKRVDEAVAYIRAGEKEKVPAVITASGNSSFKYLQNCYPTGEAKEQPVALALALTDEFMAKESQGCYRVHGGGFAGVIMCAVKKERTQAYVDYMSTYFGKDNVYVMNIRQQGAVPVAL